LRLMDKLSKEWQEKFEKIWDGPSYRMGSPGQRIVKRFREYAPEGCTVNDYGAGTGRASVELMKLGYQVNMIDLAKNALENEALGLLGKGLTFTHASLWDLPKDLPTASWGYCMEVLQVLPYEKLDATLGNIQRTSKNCFFQVANWPDRWNGERANNILEDAEWWEDRLNMVWDKVLSIRSLEIDKRYLFACYGAE
jgi:hypothetical protein